MVATYNKYKGIEAEGKPEKMLTEMGVAVRDSSGQFRDFGTVMDDLNVKWKTMSQTEKIATSQQVAGIQRYNQFMSLMNNYQMAIDSTTTALNSQGSATKENEIYMQSAKAKIEQLKTSLQEMAMNFIDSDGVKASIDGLNKLVQVFDNIPLVVSLATTALLLFKGKAILGGISSLVGYIATLGSLAVTEGVVATATTELSFAFGKLKTAIMTNPLGAIAVAITAVIGLLYTLDKKSEETTESVKNMGNDLAKSLSSYNQTKKANDGLSDLIDKQEELRKKLNDTKLSSDELKKAKEELLQVEKQIAQALPESSTGYDSQNEAISDSLELNKQLLESKKAQQEVDLRKNVTEAQQRVDEANKEYAKVKGRLDNLEYEKSTNKKNIENLKENGGSQEEIDAQLKNITEINKAMTNERGTLAGIKSGLLEANVVYEEFNKTVGDSVGEHKDLIKLSDYEIDKYLKQSDAVDKLTNSQKRLNDIKNGTAKDLKKYDEKDKQDSAKKGLVESIESIENIQKIINEVGNGKKFDDDTLKQIIEMYPELASKINDTGYVVDYLKGKISDLGKTQKQAYIEMIENDEGYFESSIKNTSKWESLTKNTYDILKNSDDEYTRSLADNMKTDLSNCKTLAEAKLKVENELMKILAEGWAKYYSALSAGGASADSVYDSRGQINQTSLMSESDFNNQGGSDAFGKSYQQYADDLNKKNNAIKEATSKFPDYMKDYNDTYDKTKKALKDFEDNISIPDTIGSIGSNITDNAEKEKEKIDYSVALLESLRDAYQRLNSVIEKTQHELDILDKRTQNAYGYNRTDLMKQKIQYLERERDLTNQLANTYRSEAQSQRNSLSSKGVQFDSDGLISNYNEILEAMRQSANAMSSYDDASKQAKENAIESVKELKSSMDDYSNTTIKGLQSAETSWEDLANTIKDQYKEIVQLTATAEDKISDIIQKEIEKRYDKRKEALEKQKQLYEDSYKDEDYEDSKAELEDKIQTINSDLTSAIKSQNQSAIKDLQQQKADAIKELNDLVTDKERENAGGVFDKALEDIDTQKEDMLKTENLTEMVTQAMQSGFINVNGEIINLSDSMNTFLKESVVGTANLKLQMDELATSISNGVAGLKDLGSYSGFLNSSNLVNNTLSENGLSGANGAYYTKNNSSNVTYKAGDVYVQGNVTEDVFPKLKAEMQYIANSEINKFVKYVNGQ